MEGLIAGSSLNLAERGWQQRFIFPACKWLFWLSFLLLSADQRYLGPDRSPMPDRVARISLQPLALGQVSSPNVRLKGAWTISADDPRVAGLSALAARPGEPLLALSDSGVLIDLPRPAAGRTAFVRDIPAGPGTPIFKKHRDSEAMVADESGLLVTFEFRHSLWHYGRDGRIASARLPRTALRRNAGIEAMVHDPQGRLLLLPELADHLLVRTQAGNLRRQPLAGRKGAIADATRLPDGRMVVALREVTWLGISNHLAWLERTGAGYRLRPFATLPLGPFDNVEGLAAEPLGEGGTRLWAVTDNDGWRRTLLLEMEIEASGRARPGRP